MEEGYLQPGKKNRSHYLKCPYMPWWEYCTRYNVYLKIIYYFFHYKILFACNCCTTFRHDFSCLRIVFSSCPRYKNVAEFVKFTSALFQYIYIVHLFTFHFYSGIIRKGGDIILKIHCTGTQRLVGFSIQTFQPIKKYGTFVSHHWKCKSIYAQCFILSPSNKKFIRENLTLSHPCYTANKRYFIRYILHPIFCL